MGRLGVWYRAGTGVYVREFGKPEGVISISERGATIAIAAIVVLAAALRIYDANSQLWYDEIATTVSSIREPLGTIVTHFPSNNDHVLYSVLSHLAISAFGETAAAIRSPAILLGIASILLIYSCGVRVTNRFEALAAALVGAVSYHHVWFSQNARGYTALLCVALLSTQLMLVALDRDKRSAWIAFGLVCALGAYTHLTMVLGVVGQFLVLAAHILITRRRFVIADWIGPAIGFGVAALATVALYAPLLGDVHSFFVEKANGPKAATAGWALVELVRGLQSGSSLGGVMVLALLLGAAAFLAGIWSYLRQSPLVLGLFLVPGAVVYLVSLMLDRPTFPRFFFFVVGFALLIAMRGVMVIIDVTLKLARGRLAPLRPALSGLAVVCMVVVAGSALPRSYGKPKQDFVGAMRWVEAAAAPDEPIIAAGNGTGMPYTLFYRRPWPEIRSAKELDDLRRGRRAVWVLYTFRRYIRNGQPDLLDSIEATCEPPREFPGTLADGDILVRRCKGTV
jgi:mannosyltransferase